MSTPSRRILDRAAHERPRERLASLGAAALSDAELVAVMLGSGQRGESAVDVARTLLAEWGGVSGLASARVEDLARTPGIGSAKATRLVAAFALASRADGSPEGVVVARSADIARAAAPLIANSAIERVAVVVCDGRNRVTKVAVVAQGGATTCPLPTREILSLVLRHDGVAFAVAHNHPAGDPAPSNEDVASTMALKAAAAAAGLKLLDHVILAGTRWKSITPAN